MTKSAAFAAALAAASFAAAPAVRAAPAATPPSAEGRIVLPANVHPVRYDLTIVPDLKA
jgi:hypothetical protein